MIYILYIFHMILEFSPLLRLYSKYQEPVLSLVIEMILSNKAKTMQNHEN